MDQLSQPAELTHLRQHNVQGAIAAGDVATEVYTHSNEVIAMVVAAALLLTLVLAVLLARWRTGRKPPPVRSRA